MTWKVLRSVLQCCEAYKEDYESTNIDRSSVSSIKLTCLEPSFHSANMSRIITVFGATGTQGDSYI
jgi:hypothetical protein